MRVKAILGAIIAVTLVLSLSLPAIAAKPTPVLNVGSITYTVDGFTTGIDEIVVQNISWQKVHPHLVRVYVRGELSSTQVGYTSQVSAPKGKAGKYPQDVTVILRLNDYNFDSGADIDVFVLLVTKKGRELAKSGILTTLTWGTNHTWTAP
jgi:hypothetical protein